MLWSEYQLINHLVLEMAFIRTYKRMGVQADDTAIETRVFD